MKVHHGFYISEKKKKKKKKNKKEEKNYTNLNICYICFFVLYSDKIAVFVEIFRSCKCQC